MREQTKCDSGLKRYQVVKGSESGHRWFAATVIDTEKEALGCPIWACECFDLSRAHVIADAMNVADEAPLNEKAPIYLDRCGKEFDVHSALLYFPGGDPALVLPNQTEFNTVTGRWEMYVTPVVDGHQYVVRGTMFKKHSQLLKLEASVNDIEAAF